MHRLFRSRLPLQMEILALRPQLAVYQRTSARPRLKPSDRAHGARLSRAWPGWREVMVIVQPETLIAWRRRRFGQHRARPCRSRKPRRPATPREIRDLTHFPQVSPSEPSAWREDGKSVGLEDSMVCSGLCFLADRDPGACSSHLLPTKSVSTCEKSSPPTTASSCGLTRQRPVALRSLTRPNYARATLPTRRVVPRRSPETAHGLTGSLIGHREVHHTRVCRAVARTDGICGTHSLGCVRIGADRRCQRTTHTRRVTSPASSRRETK
jgi:hypothetical protein